MQQADEVTVQMPPSAEEGFAHNDAPGLCAPHLNMLQIVFVLQADQVTVKIPADFQLEEDLPTVMSQLSTFIYKHGEERSKARAMLCCIFFEAIHNNFYTVS